MRKNNKKSLTLAILTACMLLLGACGKSEQQATAEVDNNEVSKETAAIVEDTKSVEPTKETTEVEKISKKDLVDVVVGGDVISVNDFTTPNREFHLSMLPEIHILIPAGNVVCTEEEGDQMHLRQYEITVPGTDGGTINCKVNLNGQKDCYCGPGHEENVEFGRYTLDYNWRQFAIYDESTDTAIVIGFNTTNENMTDYIYSIADINIEYIKQQMTEWPQEFIPDVAEINIDDAEENDASDNDGLLECDIIPCGFYDLDGNKYVMVSTYDDDDSGECMLMFGRYDGADSPFDYYDLENVENNTYSATNWDKVSVTVTFYNDGMDLSGGTGELEEYNGHYTLQ